MHHLLSTFKANITVKKSYTDSHVM